MNAARTSLFHALFISRTTRGALTRRVVGATPDSAFRSIKIPRSAFEPSSMRVPYAPRRNSSPRCPCPPNLSRSPMALHMHPRYIHNKQSVPTSTTTTSALCSVCVSGSRFMLRRGLCKGRRRLVKRASKRRYGRRRPLASAGMHLPSSFSWSFSVQACPLEERSLDLVE